MSSSTAPTYLPPPSSFASHPRPSFDDSSSTFRPLSAAPTSSSGHIALHKDSFPLLHSLLESPAYKEALQANPALARRPTARRSDDVKGSSKQSKCKPPKSGSASAAVSDLWAKVPRGKGTASSVSGGRATRSALSRAKRSSDEKWELVGTGEELESLQDGLLGAFPLAATKKNPPAPTPSQAGSGAMSRKTSLRQQHKQAVPLPPTATSLQPPVFHDTASQTRRLLPLPASSPFDPQLSQPSLPPIPPSAPSKSSAPQPLPAPVPPPPALPPPPASSNPYPSRAGNSQRDLHISTSTLPLSDGPPRPPSSFQTAVSQLKRMLTRTSKPRRGSRSSLSPSSLGGGSVLSQSTVYVGGGGAEGDRSQATSMLSQSPTSGYIDIAGEVEELVISPTTYGDRTAGPSHIQPVVSSSATRRRPSIAATGLNSSAPLESPAISTPADFSSLLPSFKSPLSFSTSTASPQTPPRPRPPLSPLSPPISQRHSARSPPNPRGASAAREARSQLLQLLRDGPEAVARASPALSSVEARRAIGETLVEKSGGSDGRSALGRKKTGGLKWKGSVQALRWKPSMGMRRSSRASTADGGSRRPSLATTDTLSLTSSNDAPATPLASSSSSRPRPHASSPPVTTPPPLGRAHSFEHLQSGGGEGWALETVERPASTYSSYGNRWLVEGAAPSLYATRTRGSMGTSLMEGGGEGGEEERRVWRKWRGWVRERREREA
ncbi:hypothetical protein JCM6882_002616 [Rhodosporidiobolus microsporus]